MNTIENAFHQNEILRFLAKDHSKLTRRRRQQHRYDCLLTGIDTIGEEQWIDQFSPSRHELHRFRPRDRESLSPQAATEQAFRHCARVALSDPRHRPGWAHRLGALIARVQHRALVDPEFSYRPPEVISLPKAGQQFRPIVQFDPEDSLIERCFARWVREQFEPWFLPCSIAFRARRGRTTQQHPVLALHQVRLEHGQRPLWCAEADIQSFYDTLDHEIVGEAFHAHFDLLLPCSRKRALELLEALLEAYSFPQEVLASSLPLAPGSQFSWPVGALRKLHNRDPFTLRIGIPQGAALSGVIANLVLHEADEAVREVAAGHEEHLFYRRYCDDMILCSPDKGLCTAAFEAYLETLTRLRIPVHPPGLSDEFGREFSRLKSKQPYPWGPDQNRDAARVGFLGYQIRHDGQVRIRPSTVRAHQAKLERELALLRRLIRQGHRLRTSKPRMMSSIGARILAMSTGRADGANGNDKCWGGAFKLLKSLPFDRRQIAALDRFRNHLIGRVAGLVLSLPKHPGKATRPMKKDQPERRTLLHSLRHYHVSYRAFFNHRKSPKPAVNSSTKSEK